MYVEPGDIPLIIRPDGKDKYTIVADMRDVGLWERIGPRNTLRKLQENPSSDDFYSLAHLAHKRQQIPMPLTLAEFKETTVVAPDQNAAASAGLDRHELVAVLDRAMSDGDATPEFLADVVLDLLEQLQERALDPTRPVR